MSPRLPCHIMRPVPWPPSLMVLNWTYNGGCVCCRPPCDFQTVDAARGIKKAGKPERNVSVAVARYSGLTTAWYTDTHANRHAHTHPALLRQLSTFTFHDFYLWPQTNSRDNRAPTGAEETLKKKQKKKRNVEGRRQWRVTEMN